MALYFQDNIQHTATQNSILAATENTGQLIKKSQTEQLMPVKLEPYSTNTLITVDTENADSRLIHFKDGFNFEESYQDWSSNVSMMQTHNFTHYKVLFECIHFQLIYFFCIIDTTEMRRLRCRK